MHPVQKQLKKNKILLIILDGWGHSTKYHGNAIKQANTPTLDLLWHNCPSVLLNASENYVGLPKNQVGNSEVGHTMIGAGRIINQALVRISKSIDTGAFFNNKTIHRAYHLAEKKGRKMHLLGLCSNGGVHSHIQHLIALIKISQSYTKIETCIHIITDGRDSNIQSAGHFIRLILEEIKESSNIRICTISGRYYVMDRDCRWQRTMRAYECLTNNHKCKKNNNPFEVLKSHYDNGIYDEFITPTRISKGAIETYDSIICFNFRPDRMRQLVQALYSDSFEGFKREKISHINMVTFTTYDHNLNIPIVFSAISSKNFLGEVIAEQGFKQFRLAETEKYAHVTYFFNGGKEAPFPGEYRELIPSPRVETYDLKPQMAAKQITRQLINAFQKSIYKLIVVNYANPDMIGHTGKLKEAKEGIETVDQCINELLKSISNDKEAAIVVTSDHGNADIMLNENNEIYKSHTKNLVPLIIINTADKIEETETSREIILQRLGSLADIAPTILDILDIKQPNEMSGQSLIKKITSQQ